MITQLAILVLGLALLWIGAELMIRNASHLARSLGVSPIIVGLTVISIGTSLPEFVVSLMAAINNTMGISIGNIVGSNIANIGLILGVGAIMATLEVERKWVIREVPAMIAFTLLFVIFSRSGFVVSRIEGIVLLILLTLFLLYLSRHSLTQMREFREDQQKSDTEQMSIWRKLGMLLLALVGIGVVVAGSKLTVSAGQNLAQAMGVSDTVIGLTLIALGTSLPELATTIVGIMRKETDLVIGNIIGSNIFNLLFIGGAVSVIRPIDISTHLFYLEFPVLIGISLLIWGLMRYRWNVSRWEGVLLLLIYLLFVVSTFSV